MNEAKNSKPSLAPAIIRSLVAIILGSMLLRASNSAMGENLQFYFNAIHAAVTDPSHPLRVIAGETNLQPISYTLGGLIIAAFFVTELLGSLILGAWSDRFGRKWFIYLGPLLGAFAVIITSVTTSIWLLVFTRLLEGLSAAANGPATLGYIAEATSDSPQLRSKVIAFFEVATIGGIALGFSLGGYLWRAFGQAAMIAGIRFTSPAFAVNALIYIACFGVLWFGLRGIKETRRRGVGNPVSPMLMIKRYWEILRSPRVINFAPAWIAINAVLGIWFNLSARILTDKTGYPNQILVGQFDSLNAGNIRAMYAVFFIGGILLWGLFFPNIKRTTIMLIGSAGLIGSCLVIFAINHMPSLSAAPVIPLSVLLVFTILIQSGFTPAALAYLADITEGYNEDRGAIMGLYSVFLGLGQVIGTGIGGIFVDWLGMDGMSLITGLLGLLAAFLVVRMQIVESRLALATTD